MPKIVDAEERRREVAEAVLRVAARDGLAQASLRNVAAEAGLAIGSVRHFCGTHDELLALAFQELIDRTTSRLMAHRDRLGETAPGSPQRLELAVEMFAELLPLDEARRREAAVWLAFTTAARTDEKLEPYVVRFAEGLRALAARVTPSELEVDRICALVDGLTLQAVTTPRLMPPERAVAVLRAHLAQARENPVAPAPTPPGS